MRNTIIINTVLLLIFSVCFCEISKISGGMSTAKVKEIVAAQKADQKAAINKYSGKEMTLTGNVGGVYYTNQDYYIILSVPSVNGPVNQNIYCYFERSQNNIVKKLQRFAIVTIKGIFDFKDAKLIMNKSKIQ